ERGEDHQEGDGPEQRGGDRVLHGPGVDGGGGVGVAEQVAGGGGDRADRVPVGDTRRTAGMRWVGTRPLDTMARGNRMTRPTPWADSGPLLTLPRQPQAQDRA